MHSRQIKITAVVRTETKFHFQQMQPKQKNCKVCISKNNMSYKISTGCSLVPRWNNYCKLIDFHGQLKFFQTRIWFWRWSWLECSAQLQNYENLNHWTFPTFSLKKFFQCCTYSLNRFRHQKKAFLILQTLFSCKFQKQIYNNSFHDI